REPRTHAGSGLRRRTMTDSAKTIATATSAPIQALDAFAKVGSIVTIDFGPRQIEGKRSGATHTRDAALALERSGAAESMTQAQIDGLGAMRVEIKNEIDALEAQRTPVTKALLALKAVVDSWFVPSRDAYQEAYDALGRIIG